MLIEREPYSLSAAEKQPLLLQELNALTQHHQHHCLPYQHLLNAQWPDEAQNSAQTTAQLPYLAVRLFKQLKLQSVPDANVFKVLYSSGTTGTPSRIVLDSATLWVLVRALGVSAPPLGLFAGFMLASVLRSIGIVPGGLGAFEAAAVVTLHWVGVNIAVALSATLLFRGLTFWLPMLPGLWLAHREWRSNVKPPARVATGDYWSPPVSQVFSSLHSTPQGLSEADANARLKLSPRDVPMPQARSKGPRYTPVSKRQDKPDGIAWILRNHPEVSDAQIGKLIGTTRNTITAIRERSHWNISASRVSPAMSALVCSAARAFCWVTFSMRATASLISLRLADCCLEVEAIEWMWSPICTT